VRDTICYGPDDRPFAEGEPRLSHLAFIGRELDREAIVRGFK
jgi:hypothetical protein